jgi:hypothetical protein
VKILSNCGQRDDDDEKIECIERPSEEARGERCAMIALVGIGRGGMS